MKVLLSLTTLLLLVSCSHSGHKHGSHSPAEEHKSWEQEHEKLEGDHKTISEVFRWFENHVKKHVKKKGRGAERRSGGAAERRSCGAAERIL